MPTIDPLRVINIDGVPHVVEQMSDEVKSVVAIYNEWRQKEVDARNRLLLVQSALRDLGQNLVNRVREEQEAATTAAAAATEAAEAEAAKTEATVEATEEVVEEATILPAGGNGAVVEDSDVDSNA